MMKTSIGLRMMSMVVVLLALVLLCLPVSTTTLINIVVAQCASSDQRYITLSGTGSVAIPMTPRTSISQSDFSFCFWVNAETTSGTAVILSFGDPTGLQVQPFWFGLCSDYYGMQFGSASCFSIGELSSTNQLVWVYRCVTYTYGIPEYVYVYTNGGYAWDGTAGTYIATPPSDILYIGDTGDHTAPWQGSIDDLRIWKTVLTSGQIAASYDGTTFNPDALPLDSLVLFYSFNEANEDAISPYVWRDYSAHGGCDAVFPSTQTIFTRHDTDPAVALCSLTSAIVDIQLETSDHLLLPTRYAFDANMAHQNRTVEIDTRAMRPRRSIDRSVPVVTSTCRACNSPDIVISPTLCARQCIGSLTGLTAVGGLMKCLPNGQFVGERQCASDLAWQIVTPVSVDPSTPFPALINAQSNLVYVPRTRTLVLVGADGTADGTFLTHQDVWVSTDLARTWRRTKNDLTHGAGGAAVVNGEGTIFLIGGVGNGQAVSVSSDSGEVWSAVDSLSGPKAYTSVVAIPSTGDMDLLLAGGTSLGKEVWRYYHQQKVWLRVTSTPGWEGRTTMIGRLVYVQPTNLLMILDGAVGLDLAVWTSGNDGRTWKELADASTGLSAMMGSTNTRSGFSAWAYNGLAYVGQGWDHTDNTNLDEMWQSADFGEVWWMTGSMTGDARYQSGAAVAGSHILVCGGLGTAGDTSTGSADCHLAHLSTFVDLIFGTPINAPKLTLQPALELGRIFEYEGTVSAPHLNVTAVYTSGAYRYQLNYGPFINQASGRPAMLRLHLGVNTLILHTPDGEYKFTLTHTASRCFGGDPCGMMAAGQKCMPQCSAGTFAPGVGGEGIECLPTGTLNLATPSCTMASGFVPRSSLTEDHAIQSAGSAMAVCPNGDIFLIGGFFSDTTRLPTVFRSHGLSGGWVKVANVHPAYRVHASAVCNARNEVYAIGGNFEDSPTSWTRSTDRGATWMDPAPTNIPAVFMDADAVLVPSSGYMAVLIGSGAQDLNPGTFPATSAIVRRFDTRTFEWTVVCAAAPWAARNGYRMAYVGQRLILAGGRNGALGVANVGTFYNDIWTSLDDGVSWTLMPDGGGRWSPRAQFNMWSSKGVLTVAFGAPAMSGLSLGDMYQSVDAGLSWTQVSTMIDPNGIGRRSASSAVIDGLLLMCHGARDQWINSYEPNCNTFDLNAARHDDCPAMEGLPATRFGQAADRGCTTNYLLRGAGRECRPGQTLSGQQSCDSAPTAWVQYSTDLTSSGSSMTFCAGKAFLFDSSALYWSSAPETGTDSGRFVNWNFIATLSSRTTPGFMCDAAGTLHLVGGDGYTDSIRSYDTGNTWSAGLSIPDAELGVGKSTLLIPSSGYMDLLTFGLSFSASLNLVWRYSANTTAWSIVCTNPAWGTRTDFAVTYVSSGALLLLGGQTFTDPSDLNDLWRSDDDGRSWNQLELANGYWSTRHGHYVWAVGERLYLAHGNEDSHQDMWMSRTGSDWTYWTQVGDGLGGKYGLASGGIINGAITWCIGSIDPAPSTDCGTIRVTMVDQLTVASIDPLRPIELLPPDIRLGVVYRYTLALNQATRVRITIQQANPVPVHDGDWITTMTSVTLISGDVRQTQYFPLNRGAFIDLESVPAGARIEVDTDDGRYTFDVVSAMCHLGMPIDIGLDESLIGDACRVFPTGSECSLSCPSGYYLVGGPLQCSPSGVILGTQKCVTATDPSAQWTVVPSSHYAATFGSLAYCHSSKLLYFAGGRDGSNPLRLVQVSRDGGLTWRQNDNIWLPQLLAGLNLLCDARGVLHLTPSTDYAFAHWWNPAGTIGWSDPIAAHSEYMNTQLGQHAVLIPSSGYLDYFQCSTGAPKCFRYVSSMETFIKVTDSAPWAALYDQKFAYVGNRLVMVGGTTAYAGPALGQVWNSLDDGASWFEVTTDSYAYTPVTGNARIGHALWSYNQMLIQAFGQTDDTARVDAGIYLSLDAGASWQSIATSDDFGNTDVHHPAFTLVDGLLVACGGTGSTNWPINKCQQLAIGTVKSILHPGITLDLPIMLGQQHHYRGTIDAPAATITVETRGAYVCNTHYQWNNETMQPLCNPPTLHLQYLTRLAVNHLTLYTEDGTYTFDLTAGPSVVTPLPSALQLSVHLRLGASDRNPVFVRTYRSLSSIDDSSHFVKVSTSGVSVPIATPDTPDGTQYLTVTDPIGGVRQTIQLATTGECAPGTFNGGHAIFNGAQYHRAPIYDSYFTVGTPVFSICFWSFATHTTQASLVFSLGDPNSSYQRFQFMYADTSGDYQLDFGGGVTPFTTPASPDDRQRWVHFCLVLRAGPLANTFRDPGVDLYRNGVLFRTFTPSGNSPSLFYLSPASGSNVLTIGSNAQRDAFFFGALDEFRVYKLALTPQQVAAGALGSVWPSPTVSNLATYVSFNQEPGAVLDEANFVYSYPNGNVPALASRPGWTRTADGRPLCLPGPRMRMIQIRVTSSAALTETLVPPFSPLVTEYIVTLSDPAATQIYVATSYTPIDATNTAGEVMINGPSGTSGFMNGPEPAMNGRGQTFTLNPIDTSNLVEVTSLTDGLRYRITIVRARCPQHTEDNGHLRFTGKQAIQTNFDTAVLVGASFSFCWWHRLDFSLPEIGTSNRIGVVALGDTASSGQAGGTIGMMYHSSRPGLYVTSFAAALHTGNLADVSDNNGDLRRWTHYCIVVNAGTSAQLYRNGSPLANAAIFGGVAFAPLGGATTSERALFIGGFGPNAMSAAVSVSIATHAFPGRLDEVRLYTVVLTDADLYNAWTGTSRWPATNLLVHYPFSDQSSPGTYCFDHSGNGRRWDNCLTDGSVAHLVSGWNAPPNCRPIFSFSNFCRYGGTVGC